MARPAPFPLLRAGRTEAIVDAELGILLRVAWLDGGEPADVTELTSLEINPATDAAALAGLPGQDDGRPGQAAAQ
jgi:hypothetical protein